MAIKLSLDNSTLLKSSVKLKKRYLWQALMIGFAIILGVLVTHLLLRQLLVKEALSREADYFWGVIEKDQNAPLAATKNLKVYLLPRDRHLLPDIVDDIHPGYHDYNHLEHFNVAYLTKNQSGEKLLILFNRSEVDSLVLLFGVVPLTLALIVLYISLFLSYRYSRQLISPANMLAEKIRNTNILDIDKSYFSPDSQLLGSDKEITTIAIAIRELIDRIELFVEREKNFTRDVSHELRSSITVVKMASDMLSVKPLPEDQSALLEKIRDASKDMEEMTEFFLILAREGINETTQCNTLVNRVVDNEIDKLSLILSQKPVSIVKEIQSQCKVNAPEKVLSILIGNLLRNALLYTDVGQVKVQVFDHKLVITDTGIGISEKKLQTVFDCYSRDEDNQRKGFGIGLSIVKRLCDRFSWDLNLVSEKFKGTQVHIIFNKE